MQIKRWQKFIYNLGHIPRNIRVCLSLIDMAAPYINLYKIEN